MDNSRRDLPEFFMTTSREFKPIVIELVKKDKAPDQENLLRGSPPEDPRELHKQLLEAVQPGDDCNRASLSMEFGYIPKTRAGTEVLNAFARNLGTGLKIYAEK